MPPSPAEHPTLTLTVLEIEMSCIKYTNGLQEWDGKLSKGT
jgi:hypothetical protein